MSQAIIDALVATVTEKVSAANAIAEKVGAASSTVNSTLKDFRENSDHEIAVAYRDRYEKMQAVILKEREEFEQKAKEILGVTILTEAETEKAKEEYKDLAKVAKEAIDTTRKTAEMLGLTLPETFPTLLTFKGKAKAEGGHGTGTRRLRFAKVTINGTVVENLSKAALKITSETGVKVTAGDLQKALFTEAGTEDVAKFPSDVDIKWSETDKDGKTHSYDIVCVKQDGNGETVKSEASESEADEAEATETE